jgi:hypothetical protein
MADEQLRLILEAIDKNVTAVLSKVNTEMDKTGKTANESSGFLSGFSDELTSTLTPLALGAAAATALGAGLKFSIDQAAEAELAQAKLGAVLAATGGAAGLTQSEVNRLSSELSRMSGVDDEVITNAEAVLLTFRSVGKDVFPEATKAALSMSMVMGGDLQSSITMVGKALNDPIQGIGALRRVGVQLTDSQEKMVKEAMAVNDIFAAQQIILGELNSEFGNAAEKMGNTYTGSVNKFRVELGNLGQTVGDDLLPQLTELTIEATTLTRSISENWTTIQHWIGAWELVNSVVLGQGVAGFEDLSYWLGDYDRAANKAMIATSDYDDLIERMSASQRVAISTTEMSAEALELQAKAAQEASDGYKTLLGEMLKVSNEDEAYTAKMAELAGQRKQVEQDLATARAGGYWDTSEKVQGYEDKLADLDQKIADTASKHSQATNQMIYDMTLAKYSVGGVTDAEFVMAQQVGVSLGIFSQAEADQAIKMNDLASAVVNGKLKIEDMGKAIEMLPNSKSIDVVINALTNFNSSSYQVPRTPGADAKYATGTEGWETVPAGYPNDSYPIGLTSGEKFAVIPPGKSLGESMPAGAVGGGNTFVMQASFSSMLSLSDEGEIENALYPAFLAMLERARSDGLA